MKKNRHSLPLIEKALNRLIGVKKYTKLDIQHAYNLIRIKPDDEWKTAFKTRYGHFEYKMMPFELINAFVTFQSYINRVFCNYLDVFVIIYLNDIFIFSKSEKKHEKHVWMILKHLKKHSLYIKLSKCEFSKIEVNYLKFIILTNDVSMKPSRISTIKNWSELQKHKDVQVFLNFANFYKHFIQGYSQIFNGLTALLKRSKKGKFSQFFRMTDEARQFFHDLKKMFTSESLLRHFNPELPIKIKSDVLGFAVSSILSQLHDGKWHSVVFWSKKKTTAEKNYDINEIKMLTIIKTCKE